MSVRTAIGMMSGTSMDGIDAALIRTDGREVITFGPALTIPYRDHQRRLLCDAVAVAATAPAETATPAIFNDLSRQLAHWHGDAVAHILDAAGLGPGDVDVIGFHGHTLRHAPKPASGVGFTWQAGDGDFLARLTGIPVVSNFRSADVAAGGEGAPLAPLYHAALLASRNDRISRPAHWPVAVLNLGGVGNVTFVGAPDDENAILAFDTGPGNALVDDWMWAHSGVAYDAGGAVAAGGRVQENLVEDAMNHPYFGRCVPKSLDRDAFAAIARGDAWRDLDVADGAATLTAFTAASVAAARDHLPEPCRSWYVCGGGRHNATLMAMVRARLGVSVEPVEVLGWRGDHLEAEAFACLAVRSLDGLPLSLPGTTGVGAPVTGGRFSFPPAQGRDQGVR